jgi:hypothetical protein
MSGTVNSVVAAVLADVAAGYVGAAEAADVLAARCRRQDVPVGPALDALAEALAAREAAAASVTP